MDKGRLVIRNKKDYCSQSRHGLYLQLILCWLFAVSPFFGEGVKMEDFKVIEDILRSPDPLCLEFNLGSHECTGQLAGVTHEPANDRLSIFTSVILALWNENTVNISFGCILLCFPEACAIRRGALSRTSPFNAY